MIFHPDWWSQPPAMLKGWVDRVFRQGVAYELEGEDGSEKKWKGLLAGRRALFSAHLTPRKGSGPCALESLWKDAVLGRCGMEAECYVVRDMRGPDPVRRRDWMKSVTETLLRAFGQPGQHQSMTSASLRAPSAIGPGPERFPFPWGASGRAATARAQAG